MKDTENDILLLAAFQHGDPMADKQIFERFFQPLCLFGERITGDLQQAEDVVADAFEKLIDRRNDFDAVSRIKSFLYQIVHNASINLSIASKRHKAIHENIRYLTKSETGISGSLVRENEILRAELIREIYDEIENLPDKCRQIFKMIFVEELSTDEISAKLSINVQTVRSQKARAIQLIRTSLLKKNRIPTLLLFGAIAFLTALS
jgi:RNA polymerase sigma-70 factor (family 1)